MINILTIHLLVDILTNHLVNILTNQDIYKYVAVAIQLWKKSARMNNG